MVANGIINRFVTWLICNINQTNVDALLGASVGSPHKKKILIHNCVCDRISALKVTQPLVNFWNGMVIKKIDLFGIFISANDSFNPLNSSTPASQTNPAGGKKKCFVPVSLFTPFDHMTDVWLLFCSLFITWRPCCYPAIQTLIHLYLCGYL